MIIVFSLQGYAQRLTEWKHKPALTPYIYSVYDVHMYFKVIFSE